MPDAEPESEPDAEGEERDWDEVAADLALDAKESYEEKREAQEEFLETVAEEEGAEVLETKCNLIGDYVVPLRAKLNGDLMDELGAVDDRLGRLENGAGAPHEIGQTADDVSQLLADIIDDPEWDKRKFYAAYEEEGLDPLGTMLERAFEALRKERERQQGAAEGFRST